MKLKRVIRLDSTPLDRAFFTEEGYLIDTPVLTSTGIFEYANSDGSVRRELRLPDEVFDEDSLASYLAKPVIVTHDAGLVNKDNAHENSIGTILTKGFRDGDNVRAKIVIHDTDEMKESGLKELSLGYNLDLDETPGTWNGQHYDAIQRNIRINHLALVREARAGEKARLNIDSRDNVTKGVKIMSYKKRVRTKRSDGVLSPEELKKAIAEYRAKHPAPKQDADEENPFENPVPAKAEDEEEEFAPKDFGKDADEEAIEEIREKQENKVDGDEEPEETIARQDEDIQTLLDIIDTLLAEKDFNEGKTDGKNCDEDEIPVEEEQKEDGDEDMPFEKENEDDDEEDIPVAENEDEDELEEEEHEDDEDDPVPAMEESDLKPGEVLNADSIDSIVRARVKAGIAAEKLHIDGIENMSLRKAKKVIIKAVRPTVNLDGKSSSYINAAFDLACDEIRKRGRKDTGYQRKQMFNKDSKDTRRSGSSADAARERMLKRRFNKRKENK